MTESNMQTEPASRKPKLIKLAVDVVEEVHALVRALEELDRFTGGDSKAMRPLSKEILIFYGLCEAMIGELSAPGGGAAAIENLARDFGVGAKLRTLPSHAGGRRDPEWLVRTTIDLFAGFRSMSQKEAAFRATLTDRRASQALTHLRSAMDRTLIRLDLLRYEVAGTRVDVRILERRAARSR